MNGRIVSIAVSNLNKNEKDNERRRAKKTMKSEADDARCHIQLDRSTGSHSYPIALLNAGRSLPHRWR